MFKAVPPSDSPPTRPTSLAPGALPHAPCAKAFHHCVRSQPVLLYRICQRTYTAYVKVISTGSLHETALRGFAVRGSVLVILDRQTRSFRAEFVVGRRKTRAPEIAARRLLPGTLRHRAVLHHCAL